MEQEDLTASHWDDLFSPSSSSPFNGESSYSAPVFGNEFNALSINRENDEDEKDDSDDSNTAENEQDGLFTNSTTLRNESVHDSEAMQIHELEKEERKEHKQQILSALTKGAEDSPLEESVMSPERRKPNESLFNEEDSPIKIKSEPAERAPTGASKSSTLKSNQFRPTRRRNYPSDVVIKHLGGTPGDIDSLGPLGDVGKKDGKEESSLSDNKALLVEEANAPLYNIDRENGKFEGSQGEADIARIEPTSSPRKNETHLKFHIPSELEITVADPMKVGDITNAHIVYSIKTKNKNPSSTWFPKDQNPYIVARRYKDFRWIYHQLQNNHPGRIIPPPPAKQTYIGRFNESFIENRRLTLEKMLNKISQNAHLHNDPDFIMFLTCEDFASASAEREKLSGHTISLQNDENADKQNTSDSEVPSLVPFNNGGGLMSSIFSIAPKPHEPDDYFTQKREYIDDLEHNLKLFYKSLEVVSTQRVELVTILEEVSITLDELASLEFLKATNELLVAFSNIHEKLKENLDRSNLQDQLTLAFTIEEYLRIIDSIKHTFEARSKLYQQLHSFEQEHAKKSSQLEKLKKKVVLNSEKINLLTFETEKLQQKVTSFQKSFKYISETMREELEEFELEKIDEFRNSVEIYIESSIESQKEAIELWETFYEQNKLSEA